MDVKGAYDIVSGQIESGRLLPHGYASAGQQGQESHIRFAWQILLNIYTLSIN